MDLLLVFAPATHFPLKFLVGGRVLRGAAYYARYFLKSMMRSNFKVKTRRDGMVGLILNRVSNLPWRLMIGGRSMRTLNSKLKLRFPIFSVCDWMFELRRRPDNRNFLR